MWAEALYNLDFHREVLFSEAHPESFTLQWRRPSLLSFSYWCKWRTVQAATQSRPPDLLLVPKWTCAEVQQPGAWQQKQSKKNPRPPWASSILLLILWKHRKIWQLHQSRSVSDLFSPFLLISALSVSYRIHGTCSLPPSTGWCSAEAGPVFCWIKSN